MITLQLDKLLREVSVSLANAAHQWEVFNTDFHVIDIQNASKRFNISICYESSRIMYELSGWDDESVSVRLKEGSYPLLDGAVHYILDAAIPKTDFDCESFDCADELLNMWEKAK